MSREGYLIVHDEQKHSQICYGVLADGVFQLFSRRERGVLVQDVSLTRSKLRVRGVPDTEACDCPYSFSVRIQRSKLRQGRLYTVGKPIELTLSAPSSLERRAWGNAIYSWQRHYWRDPPHMKMNMTEDEEDEFFNDQHRTLQQYLRRSANPPKSATAPRALFKRARAVQSAGVAMKRKVRSSKLSFSLPPMGISLGLSQTQSKA